MINRFISVNKGHHLTGNRAAMIADESLFGTLILNKSHEILFIDQRAKEVLSNSFESVNLSQSIKFLWNTTMATTEEGHPIPYENTPFSRAVETCEAQSNVLVIRQNDGSNQYLSVWCIPIVQSDESIPFSVVCYVSHVPTVSSYKQAGDIFLNNYASQTSNLLWMVDEETNLIYANAAFFKYFTLTPDDLFKKITQVVPEAAVRAFYDDHIKVLQTNGSVTKEQKLRLADGTTPFFLIHIFPIADENGKKLAGGHAVHLPDKFEIENRLREENEQLLNINRAAHNAIWEWDMQSGNVFRNEHLLEMIGYPIEETMDLDWWLNHVHGEDRDRLQQTITDAARRKQMSWEESYRFKCADDSYKYIVDSGFVVYENNQPVKMIGSLKDVTEIRLLENRLVKEKLQKQKEISETMIEVQERERMQLGVELHDNVNQILTSVRLYVAMLNPESPADKGIKEKCIDYLDMAMEEIRKLSRDLVAPQLKENTLVENIKLLINDINGCNNLKINFSYSHEADLISAGKKLALFRITQEQVKNILKYSKACQADILLQYKNNYVELIIKDNGVGFNPQKTLRGVGLSSIHERTRFYNGNVEIKTSEGKGCMIKVNIPLP